MAARAESRQRETGFCVSRSNTLQRDVASARMTVSRERVWAGISQHKGRFTSVEID